MTATYWAAVSDTKSGYNEIVVFLLLHGANPNFQYNGFMPLYFLATGGANNVELVDLLCSAGADPRIKAVATGISPLEASRSNHLPQVTRAMEACIARMAKHPQAKTSDTAAITERFVVTGDEVYDRKTDRTWKRCNYGQTWDDQNKWCKGVTKHVPIEQASSEVEGMEGGWRLPDVGELKSIFEVACGAKKDLSREIFADVKPSEWYATSTPHDDSHIMAVQCFGLSAGVGNKMISVIRLVRKGGNIKNQVNVR